MRLGESMLDEAINFAINCYGNLIPVIVCVQRQCGELVRVSWPLAGYGTCMSPGF